MKKEEEGEEEEKEKEEQKNMSRKKRRARIRNIRNKKGGITINARDFMQLREN